MKHNYAKSKKKLFIIDFDGTISSKDSFILFSFFSISFFQSMKFWITTFFIFFFLPNNRLKERFFENFKGYDIKSFDLECIQFVNFKLSKTIKKSFINFVKTLDENSEIVIVSASISNYIKPWCDSMNFESIATELEIKDGKLTGKFFTPNCNGEEKVRRIKEKYQLSNYDEIHVFGNSKGDLPMLKLGTHKYYLYFN